MMAKDLHDIENLFHSALDDHEELPPAKVWWAVDGQLDKDRVLASEKKYRRLKRLSALLLLLLLALSIYELVLAPRGRDHVSETRGNKTTVHSAGQNDHRNVSRDKSAVSTPAPAAGVNAKRRRQKSLINQTVPPGQSAILKTGFPAFEPSKDQRSLSGQDSSGWLLSTPAAKRILAPLPTMARRAEPFPVLLPSVVAHPPDIPRPKGQLKRTGFSLSAFFSRDLASYRLKETSMASGPDNANSIRNTEEYDFSFTTGLLVEFPVKERWTLLSGLRYSYTDIIVGPRIVYAQPDNTGAIKYRVNVSAGYGYIAPSFQPPPAVGDSLNVTAIAHKLQYLGVPVLLSKNLADGKLSLQAMGGLGLNFLLNAKMETEIQQGPNEIDILTKLHGLKPVYVDGQAGVGMRYTIGNKVSLQLVPTARFALTSINNGGVVKTYPNSLGVGMGLSVKF